MVYGPKAVLFDVDGTLVRTQGVGRAALARAASDTFAVATTDVHAALQRIDFRGNTDGRIVATLCAELGVADVGLSSPLTDRYLANLRALVTEDAVVLLPGVRALVQALRMRTNTHVGLLTGNIRDGARTKLLPTGLADLVDQPGGFGEDGHLRSDVAAAAAERLAAIRVKPWGTLVIGDTPHDVRAAHRIGAPAVAVATGWTDRAELEACGAQLVLDDLSDPAPLLSLLEAL